MRQSILFAFIFLCFLLIAAWPASGSTQNLLSDIKISSDSSQEQIQLQFEAEFKVIPSLNFDDGMVIINLPHTDFAPVLSYRNVNDRFLQTIRLGKEGKSTIMEIQFSNPDFQAVGLINHQIDKEILNLIIHKNSEALPSDIEKSELTQTIETAEKAKQKTFLAGDYFDSNSITVNIIKMLLVLLVLLLFIYLLLWLYNRFFVSRFSFNKGKYSIKVSSSYHISPKQKIVILEINDVAFACGVTAHNINVISKISDDSFLDYISKLNPLKNQLIDYSDLRAQYLESQKSDEGPQKTVKKAEPGFAAELLKRVKKLRPID